MQKYKIGIDEAGRGPWCGPVTAAAFCLNPENLPEKEFLDELNDSKKLSEKKRKDLFEKIVELANPPIIPLDKGERTKGGGIMKNRPQIFFGLGTVDNFYIDEYGIKAANKEAMRRAIIEIQRKIAANSTGKDVKTDVFVDGNDNYIFEELDKKPIYIVGGDAKVLEIGGASILAKVFRDELMEKYALLYPNFGLENHKGYGTKVHREYLQAPENVTGIHRTSYKPVQNALEKKPKLLLHICCGPDTCVPVMDLKKDYEVICFWYDPNIQPRSEYDKRLEAFIKVCEIEEVEYIIGEYDVGNFFNEIKGLEHTPEKGEKCTKCYDMRLKRTALEARRLGIEFWSSTLNNSPHKDLEKMFNLGEKWSKSPPPLSEVSHSMMGVKGKELKNKLEFLKIAFRKNKGFERSVDYTKKHGIYRQNYCGCIYSDTFPGGKQQFLDKLNK